MNVGILGGGTMGLSLALRLAQQGHRVTVLEAESQLGGLATWFDYGEFTWDKYYHVVLGSDANLLGLIDELGLSSHLRWVKTRSGFLWQGRHLSMSNLWEFATFPALNLFEKLRLGLGILYCQRIRDPRPLETISAAEWMAKVFGQRVYRAVWEPLLESKYGVLAESVPATIMWSTITRYYSTRSSGGGQETLGYLSGGGLRVLFEGLEDRLRELGCEIHCGRRVTGLAWSGDSPVEVHCGDQRLEFDRVVSTLPTRVLRGLAPALEQETETSAGNPKMLGVIRVALVLRRSLSPYYITNLIQKGFPFTGIIELSSLADPSEFAGRGFVMLPRYDVPESPYFERDSDEIVNEFVDALKPVWPDIRDNLIAAFVHRERCVQALWIESPPEERSAIRMADDRLWSVNAELAGRDTLNNNAVIAVAQRAADDFVSSLEATT